MTKLLCRQSYPIVRTRLSGTTLTSERLIPRRCICQHGDMSNEKLTQAWKSYVKLRKYEIVKGYNPSSTCLWSRLAKLNCCFNQTVRMYSGSCDNDTTEPPDQTPQKVNRKKHSKTYVRKETVAPQQNTCSSLPNDIESDLRSLNHFVNKEEIRHSLDPQEFSLVNSKIIEEFLKERDVPYETGYTTYYMRCPRFVKTRALRSLKENSRLYVNSKSGYFECRACGRSGKWDLLVQNINDITFRKGKKPAECFMDSPADVSAKTAPEEVSRIYENATYLSSLEESHLQDILHQFNIEKLKLQTLDQHGIKFDNTTGSLLFPYYGYDKQLIGLKILTPDKTSLLSDDTSLPTEDDKLADDDVAAADDEHVDQEKMLPVKSTILPSGLAGLFGYCLATKRTRDVVIAGSEIDAMAIYQETGQISFTVPNCMDGLPQEILPLLEGFALITVWFGGDILGWEAAKHFGQRLNQERCSLIRPDMEHSCAYECLQKQTKLREILKRKSQMVHKAIIDFKQLRQEVYMEVSQAEIVAGVQWNRYAALNKVLKGHRRGELTVFTGPTGSGKTTFISDYSLDLCMQGVKTLWGSFEVNNVRLLRTMLSQYARESLSHNLEKFDHWANKFEELPIYFMTFHGQEELEMVIDTMAHAAYVYNIHHVVIDNLQFMMGMAKNALDRFFQQDNAIQRLRQFATDYNIHVSLVMHPRKEVAGEDLSLVSIFGGAKATQEADNVLILQDRRLTTMRGRKYIQVVKNRYDGELAMFGLQFNKESTSFDILTPEDKQRKRQQQVETEKENQSDIHHHFSENEERSKNMLKRLLQNS